MNYRSTLTLWGLPLVHIATGSKASPRQPVIAWIAIGPDLAIGLLVAIGGMAVGGMAVGGVSLGIFALGGVAIGGFAIGGAAIGIYAVGGAAIGLLAIGGGALGIHAAMGGVAIAQYAAMGGVAIATHANDLIATQMVANQPFFVTIQHLIFAAKFLPLLTLLWLPLGLFGVFKKRRGRDR